MIQGSQKGAKREPKGGQSEAKGSQREPKGVEREPKGAQKGAKKVTKMVPGTIFAPGPKKVTNKSPK